MKTKVVPKAQNSYEIKPKIIHWVQNNIKFRIPMSKIRQNGNKKSKTGSKHHQNKIKIKWSQIAAKWNQNTVKSTPKHLPNQTKIKTETATKTFKFKTFPRARPQTRSKHCQNKDLKQVQSMAKIRPNKDQESTTVPKYYQTKPKSNKWS